MTQGRGDRFELHEIEGYTLAGRYATDLRILDRDYCYIEVERYPALAYPRISLKQRRLTARARCDALNEEHRRWLHAGRWTRPRTEGTVSS